MSPSQAAYLKNLITEMKQKQLKAFDANATALTYNEWVAAAQDVEDYIDSLVKV